jgi:hypothetical protein
VVVVEGVGWVYSSLRKSSVKPVCHLCVTVLGNILELEPGWPFLSPSPCLLLLSVSQQCQGLQSCKALSLILGEGWRGSKRMEDTLGSAF